MPLYEYKCLKCGRKTEKIENMNGPHLKKCPHCGGKVEAMFSAPAIQFKGSGWYVTDYGGKKSGSDSGKEEKAAESKDTKDAAAKDSAAKGSDSKESGSKDSKDSGSKEKKSDKSEKSDRSGKKK